MPSTSPRAQGRRLTQRPESPGWRSTMYDIIFEADTPPGRWFDIALLIAILASITIVSLETVPSYRASNRILGIFTSIEWVLTGLFTIEYALRLICVRKPLHYALSFWGIIDLLSILPSYVTLLAGSSSRSFVILRSVRLLRVFRVLKLWRMMDEADELSSAVWRARNKIIVFLVVVLVAVTISGTLMYHIESLAAEVQPQEVQTDQVQQGERNQPKEQPQELQGQTQFTSIPQAMYWAIVTMTTVGYGDIVPQTAAGKMISAVLILLGYSLIIVPSTFVTAGMIQKQRVDESAACHNCEAQDQRNDATYCYRCGQRMDA